MRPEVMHILFATSSHEKTGDIITFAQFEKGDLVRNECNLEEDSSLLDSIMINLYTMTRMMDL